MRGYDGSDAVVHVGLLEQLAAAVYGIQWVTAAEERIPFWNLSTEHSSEGTPFVHAALRWVFLARMNDSQSGRFSGSPRISGTKLHFVWRQPCTFL